MSDRLVKVWGNGVALRRATPEQMTNAELAEQLRWRVEAMATSIGSAEEYGDDALALANEVVRRLTRLPEPERADE